MHKFILHKFRGVHLQSVDSDIIVVQTIYKYARKTDSKELIYGNIVEIDAKLPIAVYNEHNEYIIGRMQNDIT
jgi:hypothetical protein